MEWFSQESRNEGQLPLLEGKEAKNWFSLSAGSRRNQPWPCWHLGFSPLRLILVYELQNSKRISLGCFKSLTTNCGNWLQWQQENNRTTSALHNAFHSQLNFTSNIALDVVVSPFYRCGTKSNEMQQFSRSYLSRTVIIQTQIYVTFKPIHRNMSIIWLKKRHLLPILHFHFHPQPTTANSATCI